MDITLQQTRTNTFENIVDIDDVLQQIELFFDTRCGDVLGDATFGCDYTVFIHDLRVSASAIARKINADLDAWIDFGNNISHNVSASIVEGTYEDIILVTIDLFDATTSTKYTSNYQI